MEKLPGHYVAGLVDGEGCFVLKFRRDVRHERKNKPVYFSWDVEFAVGLRADDTELLERIQATLGCGKISITKRNFARYSAQRIDDLVNIVVPFFEQYPLYGKKKMDFELWKEAVRIFDRTQRKETNVKKGERGFKKTLWSSADLAEFERIYKDMRPFKAQRTRRKWL